MFLITKVYKTPLRISFAGGGTDIEPFSTKHGAFIVGIPINIYVTGSCKKIGSNDMNPTILVRDLSQVLKIKGSFETKLENALIKTFKNHLKNFSICYEFRSPTKAGSGLGASSGIVVNAVHCISDYLRLNYDYKKIANISFQMEREEMKIYGGFQDNFACAYAKPYIVQSNRKVKKIRELQIDLKTLKKLEHKSFLIDLGLPRKGENIISHQMKAMKYSTHRINNYLELQKDIAINLAQKLRLGDTSNFGETIQESWNLKKLTSSKITNSKIEKVELLLRKLQVEGFKVVGAGGGGHMLVITHNGTKERIMEELANRNLKIKEFKYVYE